MLNHCAGIGRRAFFQNQGRYSCREKANYAPPCSSEERFFAKRMGAQVVDMFSQVFTGFLYRPPASTVLLRQEIYPKYFGVGGHVRFFRPIFALTEKRAQAFVFGFVCPFDTLGFASLYHVFLHLQKMTFGGPGSSRA